VLLTYGRKHRQQVSKTNWSLLKQQFDALVRDQSVDADYIEKIFDMEFRRRFAELINQIREPSTQNRGHRFPRVSQ
jgi:hypothetical protein